MTAETAPSSDLVDALHRQLISSLSALDALPRVTPPDLDVDRLVGADLSDYAICQYVIEHNADVAVDTARATLIWSIRAYLAACLTHKLVGPEVDQHA